MRFRTAERTHVCHLETADVVGNVVQLSDWYPPSKTSLELQPRAQMHACLECWPTPLLYTRCLAQCMRCDVCIVTGPHVHVRSCATVRGAADPAGVKFSATFSDGGTPPAEPLS